MANNLGNNTKSTAPPKIYLKNGVLSSFVLFPPTAVEVSPEIIRLKIKKSTSNDQIPSFFLKTAADAIAPYLDFLADYMFSNGIFPDILKFAKVIPIYKSGTKSQVQNYRPIASRSLSFF